jgi:hypothetical protein
MNLLVVLVLQSSLMMLKFLPLLVTKLERLKKTLKQLKLRLMLQEQMQRLKQERKTLLLITVEKLKKHIETKQIQTRRMY